MDHFARCFFLPFSLADFLSHFSLVERLRRSVLGAGGKAAKHAQAHRFPLSLEPGVAYECGDLFGGGRGIAGADYAGGYGPDRVSQEGGFWGGPAPQARLQKRRGESVACAR